MSEIFASSSLDWVKSWFLVQSNWLISIKRDLLQNAYGRDWHKCDQIVARKFDLWDGGFAMWLNVENWFIRVISRYRKNCQSN